ncbi:hypothetical protein IFM12275_30970 [Nocardia sputorum]|nr:hypothetical protein IFM12275_30970 [Nocardia sputorum]
MEEQSGYQSGEHDNRHRDDLPGPPALSADQIQRFDRPHGQGHTQQNPADHQADELIGDGRITDQRRPFEMDTQEHRNTEDSPRQRRATRRGGGVPGCIDRNLPPIQDNGRER